MATLGAGITDPDRSPAAQAAGILRAFLLAGLTVLAPSIAVAADPQSAALTPDTYVERPSDLPAVLAGAEVAAYRRIFAAQDRSDWAGADQEIRKLKDRALVGHVLAQRYLHPNYRSSAAELSNWLAAYADHPDAAQIYKLAGRKAPRSTTLSRPVGETVGGLWMADDLGPPPDRAPPAGRKLPGDLKAKVDAHKSQIRRTLRAGNLGAAERLLHARDMARLLTDAEIDHFKGQIAAGWFAQGEDGKALELAREAANRSGRFVPRAQWIAGLSLFKQSRFREAARHFEALASIPDGEPWDIASGGFWAARAHARDRRFEAVNPWLHRAAEHPRTFYGLLAIRQLGVPTPFVWEPPPAGVRDLESIRRLPAGSRAFALIQVGQSARADAELRRVFAVANPAQMRTLLAIAMRANLPGLSIRLGREISDFEGRRIEGALYPIPPWTPSNGYQVDRALLFAFMRQESQFNTRAMSHAGARGLMQLMPQTAAQLDGSNYRGRADLLLDPVYNVTLGQRYIVQLLQDGAVQGDLIRLAAAYNGGPGNLARWTRKQDQRGGEDDALLFIESLPSPETRHFITRILYSYWMYSDRLGQSTPSLDDVAAGRWPTYIALDAVSRGTTRRNAQTR
jgi:soluble lytic murein transglycosylase-like protein